MASSRRAKFDEDGNEIVTPGCFTSRVVACPCVITWAVFGLAVGAATIGANGATIRATAEAGYDTPLLGEQVSWYAWFRVHEERYSPVPAVVSSAPAPPAAPEISHPPIYFLYEALPAVGDNIFSPDAISAMASFESVLLTQPAWTSHCAKAVNRLANGTSSRSNCTSYTSVLRYLYLNDALHEAQCRQGFCDLLEVQMRTSMIDGTAFAPSLSFCETAGTWGIYPCTSTVYDWRDGVLAPPATWATELEARLCAPPLATARTMLLDRDSTCANGTLRSGYARSSYALETTLDDAVSFAAQHYNDFTRQMMNELDAAQAALSATAPADGNMVRSGAPVNIWWLCGGNPALGWCDFDGERILRLYLAPDMSLALYSMVLIAALIALNTGSIVLTLAGLFEILASLPIAMCVWVMLGQTYVSALMLLGLFVVLCIGADDIFVFIDTWQESAVMPPSISGSMLTRFTWTYNRAASAMLATTTTTFFCLLLNAMSKFPNLRVFGIFNAFVIVADYVLVISWFAATTVALETVCQRQCPPGRNFELSYCCKPPAERKERAVTAFFKSRRRSHTPNRPNRRASAWPSALSSCAPAALPLLPSRAVFGSRLPTWQARARHLLRAVRTTCALVRDRDPRHRHRCEPLQRGRDALVSRLAPRHRGCRDLHRPVQRTRRFSHCQRARVRPRLARRQLPCLL